MTVTNTYITGNVNVVTNGSYAEIYEGDTAGEANVAGTVTLGEGVYVGGTISDNVKYADGVSLYDVSAEAEFTYLTHAWKASADYTFDESSFVANEVTETYSFTKYISATEPKIVSVTWKDAEGNVIGENTAIAGTLAAAPLDIKLITVVEGWLGGIPTEWNESLVVPKDVDEYVITAKADGELRLVADVEMLFNIKVQSHNQINFYVPHAAEGIEIVSAYIDSTVRYESVDLDGNGKLTSWSTATATFAGKKFHGMSVWPGITGASRVEWTGKVTFTYNDQTFEFSAKSSMAKYAQTVLDEQYGFSEEAKDLVVNSANYLINALDYYHAHVSTSYADTAITTALREVVAANADRITAPTEEELVLPDTSEILTYVSSVSMFIDTSSPGFRFYLTEAAKADGVTVSLSGWNSKTGTDATYGDYIQTSGGQSIGQFNKITITVDNNGTAVSLTYTVANYIKALSETADDATMNLLYAIYGYINADKNYN